jgi:acyl transferase domain-containing protein
VVIVIKLLEDAVLDGDKIYATVSLVFHVLVLRHSRFIRPKILNTAINSTGSAGPVKTPIAESQAAAMLHAYKGTGRSPTEVDFVECHSTGTSVGDPVEVNWVGAHFKRDTELLVGSVKANIGYGCIFDWQRIMFQRVSSLILVCSHTEITAFLASFSKVCSMFTTGFVPPQVQYTTPNPEILWNHYNMRAPSSVEKLIARDPSGKLLISMNASGLGGANGHCVVESPPQKTASTKAVYSGMPVLLVAAGLSPRSATTVAADLAKLALEVPDELSVLSTIYGRRARQMTWRAAAIGTSDRPFVFPTPRFVPRTTPPLVFVFSGQGPQHIESM